MQRRTSSIFFTPDPAPILALQEKFSAEWVDYKDDLKDFLYVEDTGQTLNETTGAFSPSVLLKLYEYHDDTSSDETKEIIGEIELRYLEAKTALEKYQANKRVKWMVTDTIRIFYNSQLLMLQYYKIEIINQFINKILIKNDKDKKITEGTTVDEGPRVGQLKANEFSDDRYGNRHPLDPLTSEQSREIVQFQQDKKETITSLDLRIKEFNRQFREFKNIEGALDETFEGQINLSGKADLFWRKEYALCYMHFLEEEYAKIIEQRKKFYQDRKQFAQRVAKIAPLPILSYEELPEIICKQKEIQSIEDRKTELDNYLTYFKLHHETLEKYSEQLPQKELVAKTYLEEQKNIIDRWKFYGQEPARQRTQRTADLCTIQKPSDDEKSATISFPRDETFKVTIEAEQRSLDDHIRAKKSKLELYIKTVKSSFTQGIYTHRAEHLQLVVSKDITEELVKFPYDKNTISNHRISLNEQRKKLQSSRGDSKDTNSGFKTELERILPGPEKVPTEGEIAKKAFWLARVHCLPPPPPPPQLTRWQKIKNNPIANVIFWGCVFGGIGLAVSFFSFGLDIPLIMGLIYIGGGFATGALGKCFQMLICSCCCGRSNNDGPGNNATKYSSTYATRLQGFTSSRSPASLRSVTVPTQINSTNHTAHSSARHRVLLPEHLAGQPPGQGAPSSRRRQY